MANPHVETSQRFSRAARAESERLARRLTQFETRRGKLRAELERLDAECDALSRRIEVLGALTADESDPPRLAPAEPTTAGSRLLLRGASIREIAVPLLLKEIGEAPIHYRDWYQMLCAAGYEAAGQRPDAVFLGQVTRSPLVKSGDRPGLYRIDLSAIEVLRAQLSEQEAALASSAAGAAGGGSDLAEQRRRQQELTAAIGRIQRELDEAVRATQSAGVSPGLMAA
jgi:hypothetical protein